MLFAGLDFTLYTLFDITRTDVLRTYNPSLKFVKNKANTVISSETEWNHNRNQQRNWQTVVQLLGLRSQVEELTDPNILSLKQLDNHQFDTGLKADTKVWMLNFSLSAYKNQEQHAKILELLQQDFAFVPLIVNLNETNELHSNYFITSGTNTNVYFTNNKS